jgi:hypothetical protein
MSLEKAICHKKEHRKPYYGSKAIDKTWNEHMVNNNVIRDTPVYHVWKKGKRIYCGLNYLEAVRKAEGE